jgi:hypothetical protein
LARPRGSAITSGRERAGPSRESDWLITPIIPARSDRAETAATLEVLLEAPADLEPLAALRYAVVEAMRSLPAEDLALETLRNKLIRTIPELRRGMIAEMTRPIGLLAEALEQRLGRGPDDPDVRMFAAAAVGALLTIADHESDEIPPYDIDAMTYRLDDAIARLETMLVLPGKASKSQ